MWVLIILLLAVSLLIMLLTYFNRKKKDEEPEINTIINEECCGAHEVCDKDSLLNSDAQIVYFDDEELDVLSGRNPKDFSEAQEKQLAEVFYTLRESDVAGWLKSLQLRHIGLPADLKEQALMIVSERRTAQA
jgi:hypothetical protein